MKCIKNAFRFIVLQSTLVFGRAELQHNWISFGFPLPVYALMQLYLALSATRKLGLYPTCFLLILGALTAMLYGLQCFSHEADKKTLDFIITRPLSPFVIISVKYFMSLVILCGWIFIYSASAGLSWKLLPLPEGMGADWVILIFLIIHSISFFSGLLTKGLERFFAVTAMTTLLTGVSYQIWLAIFQLVKANFFWFDIPTPLMNLITTGLPVYLTLLCLATPFIGTVWVLRSRIPLQRFTPAKWLAGFWLMTGLLVILAETWLAPPLWPAPTATAGDWHSTGGILLSGPASTTRAGESTKPLSRIQLAYPGKKAHLLYQGEKLQNPRFSPNGLQIVFSENGNLKILNLQNHKATTIGPGHTASWSSDGRKLLCATYLPGNTRTSQLFKVDLNTGRRSQVTAKQLQLSTFLWNSPNNTVYYLGLKDEVKSLNLTTQRVQTYVPRSELEKPLNYYSIIRPTILFHPATNQVIWGQNFEDELRIFGLNIQTGQINLLENLVHPRLKNASPVIIHPTFQCFLWQRMDGSFVSEATGYFIHKDDHHEDEPGHEHEAEP